MSEVLAHNHFINIKKLNLLIQVASKKKSKTFEGTCFGLFENLTMVLE